MTFIGIVIFTIYTKQTVYVGSCDPQWSSKTVCADVVVAKQEEMGRYEPAYIGEFVSLEACRAAADKASHKVKSDERLGDLTQVLCVPKVLK